MSRFDVNMASIEHPCPYSSAHGTRGGRVDIVIANATAWHALVDIVVADPTRRDLVERVAELDVNAATNAERMKETHYRDRSPRTECPSLLRQTVHCLIGRIDFWSNMQRWHLLACCAHGYVGECQLHCNSR